MSIDIKLTRISIPKREGEKKNEWKVIQKSGIFYFSFTFELKKLFPWKYHEKISLHKKYCETQQLRIMR